MERNRLVTGVGGIFRGGKRKCGARASRCRRAVPSCYEIFPPAGQAVIALARAASGLQRSPGADLCSDPAHNGQAPLSTGRRGRRSRRLTHATRPSARIWWSGPFRTASHGLPCGRWPGAAAPARPRCSPPACAGLPPSAIGGPDCCGRCLESSARTGAAPGHW